VLIRALSAINPVSAISRASLQKVQNAGGCYTLEGGCWLTLTKKQRFSKEQIITVLREH
jgi:hypothetical protein